jgi:predicted nucleotidyltransferase component of viral defense system
MQNGASIMTIELLSRQELQLLNKKGLKYPLAVAEKDYFLAVVLKIIYRSSLKDALVFKGGTALYHTYLPQLRFSQDLDFTALRRITVDELKSIFAEHDFLEVKKHYTSGATVKVERLQYSGLLAMPASLKLEIDFIQNVVLPANTLAYKNAYGVDVQVQVMDIQEMCSEKIRAMNDRFRYRDFYDFGMIMKKYKFDLSAIMELLKRKEIRKPLSLNNILEHWRLASQAKDIAQIYVTHEISDEEIEAQLKRLPLD